MRIDDWIIDNICHYGNSLVPNNLVELYGIRAVEKEISKLAGYECLIEIKHSDTYREDYNHRANPKYNRHKKETLYIASRI